MPPELLPDPLPELLPPPDPLDEDPLDEPLPLDEDPLDEPLPLDEDPLDEPLPLDDEPLDELPLEDEPLDELPDDEPLNKPPPGVSSAPPHPIAPTAMARTPRPKRSCRIPRLPSPVAAATAACGRFEQSAYETVSARAVARGRKKRSLGGEFSPIGVSPESHATLPVMFDLFKNRRRAALRGESMTPAQRAILEKNVPYVAKLDAADREELEGLVRIFLAEKSFEGCGGLTLTEEMRVTIAAQACLLLLHRETDIYPDVSSILVYPSAYRAAKKTNLGGVVVESDQARLGESWVRGVVVLAWDHVKSGAAQPADGQNVVLHEFAHQLDAEDGAMDGAPDLGARARYTSWAHVLGDEFGELSSKVHDGHGSDIDAYGATNPAEFFAVVTEMFFEKPRAMKRRHPALYEELAAFYKQDPATR